MSQNKDEVLKHENSLRHADLSPEPDTSKILDELLADDILMIGPQGQLVTKAFVLEAHRPPKKAPFDRVEISSLDLKEYGDTVIVSCRGFYQMKTQTFSLQFLRVWNKRNGRWQVVAGSVSSVS